MNLNEYKREGFVPRRIVVYGPPKTGKTELVGALAAHGYSLKWFDLEDGIKTLLRVDSSAQRGLANIELFRIPDNQTYPIATNTILKVVKGGEQSICFDHGAVDCFKCRKDDKAIWTKVNVTMFGPKDILVVDSVSQLVASTMNHITKDQVAKDENYKADWDDWRKQGFLLDRIFGLIQAGNFNFIGISHEESQKLEDGKTRLVPVGGTGNYSKTFAKYFDDIVYTDVVNGAYKAYSAVGPGTPNAILGSRAGKDIRDKGLIELFKD